jgi:phosphoglycerol transferase MdoB-like AlkP superfamily enzyme
VLTVQSEWAPLLYPLNIAILIAIPLLHVTLITAFVASVWRRVSTWRQLSAPIAVGTLIVLGYLNVFAGMHALLLGSILP